MIMKISVNSPGRKIKNLKNELLLAAENVLESGWWLSGAQTDSFAKEFSSYLGVKHCLPVANGTDALELALRALDLTEGAEIP